MLGTVAYLVWRRKNTLEEQHYEFLNKVLGVIQMVESKMEAITPVRNEIKDLQRDMESLQETVDSLQNDVEDL